MDDDAAAVITLPTPSASDAALLTFQACCLNIAVGLSAMPLACSALPQGAACGAAEAAAASLSATALQAAGTWLLLRGALPPLQRLLGPPAWSMRAAGQGLAWAAAAAAAVAGCRLLGSVFAQQGGTPMSDDGATAGLAAALDGQALSPAAVAQLAFADVALAPLLEECLFRGLLLQALLAAGQPAPQAVALQAAAFATYHLSDTEWLPLFALGSVLGAAYVRGGGAAGGGLPTSVTAHAAYNLAALALVLLVAAPSPA